MMYWLHIKGFFWQATSKRKLPKQQKQLSAKDMKGNWAENETDEEIRYDPIIDLINEVPSSSTSSPKLFSLWKLFNLVDKGPDIVQHNEWLAAEGYWKISLHFYASAFDETHDSKSLRKASLFLATDKVSE